MVGRGICSGPTVGVALGSYCEFWAGTESQTLTPHAQRKPRHSGRIVSLCLQALLGDPLVNAKCLRALISFSLSRQLFQRLWTSVGPINLPICVPPSYTFIHPNTIGLSTHSSPIYPSNQLSIYPPTHISTYPFTHTSTHLIYHCASETQTLGCKPGARVAPQPRSWLLHTQSLPLAFLSHTQLLLACPRPVCGALKTVCTGGCGTLPLPACPGHGSVGGGCRCGHVAVGDQVCVAGVGLH